jgi:serralysin
MTTQPEILNALQFAYLTDKNPINTTGAPREVITWQYAGTTEPTDMSGDFGTSYTGWTAFSTAEKTAFETALTHIETFLNVSFKQVVGSADPDLNIGKVDLPGLTAGYGGNSAGFYTTGDIFRYDSYAVFDNTLDLSAPGQFNLLLHEMGHALGLKHTFSTPALPATEDNNKYSVMSYSVNPDNGQGSDAMMLYDVFALQDIWGGAGYLAGDDIYSGPRTKTVDTVWDTGGIDVFDASTRLNAVFLDLNEGAFSMFGTYDDVVIAYGSQIENAAGGAGADLITGNGLANVLDGNDGNDMIWAGAKNDRLAGGNGDDVLYGQGGKDKLYGDAGRDTLLGQGQRDNLKGGSGNDTLKGGKGNDTLNGQAGNDKLFGNQGADKFVFALNGNKDVIRDFEDNVDSIKITGFGTLTEVLTVAADDTNGNVVFDFGNGDILTVLNTSVALISDDVLV